MTDAEFLALSAAIAERERIAIAKHDRYMARAGVLLRLWIVGLGVAAVAGFTVWRVFSP